MTAFLTSLFSKKLGFAIAVETLIQTLHTNADNKAFASAAVAVGYLLAQAWVDAHAPKPSTPEAPPLKESP